MKFIYEPSQLNFEYKKGYVLDKSLLTRFIPSKEMRAFINEEVKKHKGIDIPPGIQEYVSSEDQATAKVCCEEIEWVRDRLHLQNRSLFEVIFGTDVVVPSPPVTPRNPELEARCQRLRREQEEREYRAMTKMVDTRRVREPEDTIAYQLNQINRQLIGVVQFVFSVAAGFLFGYLGLELIFGDLSMFFRLSMGVTCALIIAVAEIYFLIKHINAADTIPEEVLQEAKKQEAEKEKIRNAKLKKKSFTENENKSHQD